MLSPKVSCGTYFRVVASVTADAESIPGTATKDSMRIKTRLIRLCSMRVGDERKDNDKAVFLRRQYGW